MRTVKMSTYLVRQADMHRNRMVILFSCGVVSAIVGPCINLLAGIFGGLIMLIVFCYLGAVEQIKWTKFMQGIRGEDLFNASLSAAIDKTDNILYQGVATDYGDIDYLLVGSSGVYAFEIKNHSGFINYNENGWQKIKISGSGVAYTGGIGNPSGQLGRNIMWLKNYLKSEGIEFTVELLITISAFPPVQIDDTSFPTVTVGNGSTTIAWTFSVKFPASSVTFHVLSIVPAVLQSVMPERSSLCSISNKAWGVQLSDSPKTLPVIAGIIFESKLQSEERQTVTAGGAVNTGFSLSKTVIF